MPMNANSAAAFDTELLSRLLGMDANVLAPETSAGDANAPFHLTDIQRGYLLGRDPALPLGGSACQFYYELDCETLDIAAYRAAWEKVIARHPMLRARMLDAASQKIEESLLALAMPVHDLRGWPDADAGLAAIRKRLARDLPASDKWPMLDVELSLQPSGRTHIHLRFDLLVTDQHSILKILDEVARFYRDPALVLDNPAITFRDYVMQAAEQAELDRAQQYWRDRAKTLPDAPQLPLLRAPSDAGAPHYERISGQVEKSAWDRVKTIALGLGITPSCILLDLFSEALAEWSETPHFCLNMTLFNRRPVHPDIDQVVGDFTTNLLFEIDLRQPERRRDRLVALQQALWRDIEYCTVSGMEVTREMALAQGHLDRPLMPVVFTSTLTQNDARLFTDAAAQPGVPILALSQTPQVILDNQVMECGGALAVNWDIATSALDITIARALFERFVSLIDRFAREAGMLDEIVSGIRDPGADDIVNPDSEKCSERLTDLWLRCLPQSLERTAVASSAGAITHQALARQVAGLVEAMLASGIGKGQTVCIYLEKSTDQIAACLAVSVIGAVYVPIDLDQPVHRQVRILSDLKADALLHAAAVPGDLTASLSDTLCLNVAALEAGRIETLFAIEGAEPDDLAYIIYTSGSTGQPKGVMVTHAAAVNTVRDVSGRFGIGAGDSVLGLSQLHFDLSVYDIFGVLGVGGALVLPDMEQRQNPAHWQDLCNRFGVSVWNTVPGLFALLTDYHEVQGSRPMPALKTIMLSGDWIPLDLPRRSRAIWPDARIHSLGGATEASIWSIFHTVDHIDPAWTSIPYGRALSRQQVFVLDENLHIAPRGKTAELYIAGDGLALGYFNDAEKSAAHFFPHSRTGLLLYRTGDLGAYAPDGSIIFQGRVDNQVKINGYRIEIGEITRALKIHPDVEDAHVLAVGTGRQPRLAAFVKTRLAVSGDHMPDLAEHLAARLPHYMVPVQWQAVAEWPLTPNGKLDRKALAARLSEQQDTEVPAASATVPAGPVANRNVERAVLDMVADILKYPAVTLEDNLVNLGASSLELIALANRIEAFSDTRPPLTELARAVRLPDLIALVEHLMPEAPDIVAEIWPGERAFRHYLVRNRPITDPVARRLFKNKRTSPAFTTPAIQLADVRGEQVFDANRRSWREFTGGMISAADLSALLLPLRRHYANGAEKRLYASAGGLYPVETYLLAAEGRAETLGCGGYYYDPANHTLSSCGKPGIAKDFTALSSGNSDWIGTSSLIVCFVTSLDAIVPLYDTASLPFSMIECGAMCQVLEQAASALPLGVCQIGDMPLQEIGRRLALPDDRLCLHTLAVGTLEPQTQSLWNDMPKLYAQDMSEGTL
jgi:amino acid adenylation domain-containing protein